jgi:plasmid stabilization system protein ParE
VREALAVRWSARAEEDLFALFFWLSDEADADFALADATSIRAHMETFRTFPERGTPRDDLSPGLRTTVYRRRTVIAYRLVDGELEVVALHHAGRDWTGEI